MYPVDTCILFSVPCFTELIESVVYLYQATKDPYLLEIGIDILESIEHSAKTSCGYATVSKSTVLYIF